MCVCELACVCVCVCVLKEWLTARVEGHPNVDSVLHSLLGKGAALRGQGRLRRDSKALAGAWRQLVAPRRRCVRGFVW